MHENALKTRIGRVTMHKERKNGRALYDGWNDDHGCRPHRLLLGAGHQLGTVSGAGGHLEHPPEEVRQEASRPHRGQDAEINAK